jgi:phosphate transport system substrate-binding protein
MKNITSKLLTLCLVGVLTATADAGNITVKGSDTLVILAQKWAEAYMRENPETKIQVNGGGSGIGFAALQNKTTDIANASRKMKSKEMEAFVREFGRRPVEYKVALDGLSIYVNEDNPVDELSLAQIEQIYTGKINNWKELGGKEAPITIFSRENSSGTYEFFKEHVLQGKDFAANAQTLQGTAQVIQNVAKEKNGIGYGGGAYGSGVKHLKIKKEDAAPAIEPSEENVVNGSYPIWRYLYIYVSPASEKGEIADYIKWILSDEGQRLVKESGYYPLPADLRK